MMCRSRINFRDDEPAWDLIMASCILHNMCIDARDPLSDFKEIVDKAVEDVPYAEYENEDEDDTLDVVLEGEEETCISGKEVRRALELHFINLYNDGKIRMSTKAVKRRLACRDFVL